MKATIKRTVRFDPADVRAALEESLRAADRPAPDVNSTNIIFVLSHDGAVLEWTQEIG